ncbi:hypothetical protein [Umezawaea sp. Da 62-37]|uniref:hypothetical protein n=1 Tax=Umezawaea sp. Da 62-37 TaxID=3075927 RepID=UPI0028F6FD92|nr:hypothetical protein [Umezawaea sp. Da 62-37]WNV90820.1 hypothetical protein RM788_21825 [Umezawaea sp. Da 62-37]
MSVPTIAGISQLVLTCYFTFTHWVPMPPFNDLRFENRTANANVQILMAVLAVSTLLGHRFELWVAAVFYSCWMLGQLFSWWIPYLTGWPKVAMEVNKQRAWAVLPRIGDRVVPDVLHSAMGVLSAVTLVSTWLAV